MYVATGLNFPDALAGAAAAGMYRAPMLLVPGDRVPTEVADEIQRLDPALIIVLGGPDVVATSVMNDLNALIGL